MLSHTFTVFRNARTRLDSLWIKITYRMFLVSCSSFLWRFQSEVSVQATESAKRVKDSVFYEAFLPITWIKPSAGVTKYSKCMGSHVALDLLTSRAFEREARASESSCRVLPLQTRKPSERLWESLMLHVTSRLRAVSYFSLQSYCTRNLSTRAAKPRAARNEGVSLRRKNKRLLTLFCLGTTKLSR